MKIIQNKLVKRLLFLGISFCLLSANGFAKPNTKDAANDWPQWRGPNGDGLSTETGLLTTWPEGGPEILWQAGSGDGYSGMSVADGRLYTLYGRDSDELLVCLDAESGEQIWQYRVDSKFTNNFGHGPRCTPTVDGNIVYGLSANGKLVALNAIKGSEVWKIDLVKKFGAKIPTWGISTSPLIYNNYLLVDVGGSGENGFMAFNKKNGKVVWKTKTDMPGYSVPMIVTVNGLKQALNFSGNELISVNPETGEKYWAFPWRTSYDVNAATPIFVSPDKVFVSSGYDVGGALLQISAGKGMASVEQIWKNRVMRNHFATSLLLGDYLYGFDNDKFKCINIYTQEEKWVTRGFGKGSATYADGHIILLSERGKLVLIQATPEKYIKKASAQILKGRCWTVPTLANGKLFIRNQKKILAIKMK